MNVKKEICITDKPEKLAGYETMNIWRPAVICHGTIL